MSYGSLGEIDVRPYVERIADLEEIEAHLWQEFEVARRYEDGPRSPGIAHARVVQHILREHAKRLKVIADIRARG